MGIDVVELLDWLGKDLVSVDQASRRVVYVSPSAVTRLQVSREAFIGQVVDDAKAARILVRLGLDEAGCARVIRFMSSPIGTVDELEYFSPGEPAGHWRRLRMRVVDSPHGARFDMVGRDIDDVVEARNERRAAEVLHAMSDAVYAAPDLAQAARGVAETVKQHLRTDRAAVAVFDTAVAPLGAVREVAGPDAALDPRTLRPLLERVVERFGAFGQFDPSELVGEFPALASLGLRSMAFCLIGSAREQLGVVTASGSAPRILSDHEMRFLRHTAERMAGPLAQKALDDERGRAARRLAEAQERLTTALEASSIGVWEWNLKTGQTTCDETCARLWELELTPGMDVAAKVAERVHADDLLVLQRAGRRAVESNDGRYRVEYRYQAPSGPKSLQQGGRCHFDAAGKPERFIGTLQDVSEARRLEAKLVAAQKLESLGVLAGGIAHDFNNLLVGVLGNAGLAKLELPPTSPANEAIDGIETAAQRASELTRQLLAYAGKARFVISTIHIEQLVLEMGHLLTAVIGKGVVLRYQFAHNLPTVRGDATQLRQVVMNLITNASDAIGERSGIVTVATSLVHADEAYLNETMFDYALETGDYVCLQVSDTGVGMSAETQARIFEPFFTTKFTGRGLGLAAVQGILRAHRGAMKVYSEPGRGTTFKVLLPVAQGASEQEPRTRPPMPAPGVGTVLVIDDEETMRNVTRRLLNAAGIAVLVAGDGVEGIEVYRARQAEIGLVLLDVTMPRMGGEETFRQLRLLNPNVRVLLASGYSEQEATAQFAGKGLAGFIEKPFQAAVLLEKVRNVLAEPPG